MKKKRDTIIKPLIITAIISAMIFALILIAERAAAKAHRTAAVAVAAKDIQTGTKITRENAKEYFMMMELPEEAVLSNALTDLNDIEGYITGYGMQAREQLTQNKITNVISNVEKGYNEPVEVSLTVNSIADAAAGTIRAGDRVDIIAYTDIMDKRSEVVMENVYVSEAFDASGREVTANSNSDVSIIFNLIIEREEYIDFINGTSLGGIRLIKISG